MTNRNELGKIIKQRRVMIPLTLRELAAKSGVTQSHLSRIEIGGRFPSARILRKIAKPLGFSEVELFTFAGFLSPQPSEEVGFAEYVHRNYPQVDEDVIKMIEDILEHPSKE